MQNGQSSSAQNHLDSDDFVHKSIDNDLHNTSAPTESTAAPHLPTSTGTSQSTHGLGITRGTKRKLSDTNPARKIKRPSPPWKGFDSDGPASFVEEGRRKSSRHNPLPHDHQPPDDQRHTRAAQQRLHEAPETSSYSSRAKNELARSVLGNAHAKSDLSAVHSSRKQTRPGFEATSTRKNVAKHQRTTSSSAHNDHIVKSPTAQSPNAYKRAYTHKRQPSRPGSKVSQTIDRTIQARLPSASKPIPPRLRLRYKEPTLPITTPLNIPPTGKHESVKALWSSFDFMDGEDFHKLSIDEAQVEARKINRVLREARPGGRLRSIKVQGPELLPAKDPSLQYPHHDYMLKHAVDLRLRMLKEAREHRANAKRIAFDIEALVKSRQPRTEHEVLREERNHLLAVHKQFRKLLAQEWNAVKIRVREQKFNDFQDRQKQKGEEDLQAYLHDSKRLVAARKIIKSRGDQDLLDYDLGASDNFDDSDDDSAQSGSDLESESEDTSSSDESSSDDNSGVHIDNELAVEDLRKKYGNLPSLNQSELESHSEPQTEIEHSIEEVTSHDAVEDFEQMNHRLEDVADELLDDSQESDSDDETESEDEINPDDESIDEDDDDDDDDETDDPGESSNMLLGLFSKSEVQAMRVDTAEIPDELSNDESIVDDDKLTAHDLSEISTEKVSIPPSMPQDIDNDIVENERSPAANEDDAMPDYDPQESTSPPANSSSDDYTQKSTPITTSADQASTADSDLADKGGRNQVLISGTGSQPGAISVPIPSLLRGELRSYQKYGLDWLAGMYSIETSGILADEMGLGKTIQTIALLAHLATEYAVWGPHLIIVPTSVLLNWEMEFKKFAPGFKILSYYGTQEERKRKRKGWMDNDSWNVCITSYQLAIQDASSLKRRNWHYMVLDEAHNIKNFRSQRWQTLLNFKTQARLLLTGTPLQNNLLELWSLLYFVEGEDKIGGSEKWVGTWTRPVDQIMQGGRGGMDDKSREIITKLHEHLRPYLMRRLKSEVEKQMPKKVEHIVPCRLSKRQRQLYDGFMSRSATKSSFSSGNFMSIMNCLMQLRKVCNHPDLFETRPITTSFAMTRSAIAEYEIKELFVRKSLLHDDAEKPSSDLLNLWRDNIPSRCAKFSSTSSSSSDRLLFAIQRNESRKENASHDNAWTVAETLTSIEQIAQQSNLDKMRIRRNLTQQRKAQQPVYGTDLLTRVTFGHTLNSAFSSQIHTRASASTFLNTSSILDAASCTVHSRSNSMQLAIQKFAFVTPRVVARNTARLALTDHGMNNIRRCQELAPQDPFHEARMRLSIAFPDKSLIQYDCGKLQELDKLLRKLQAGGHRALIFTQMTKVLDILEQFLNLHGHRYLRLDGATRIEQRQVLTERFNSDPKILAFILSSRSGGLGINLTGADTVIFYDSDWNPAMDKQCQDRCHRIGQTRDVHIYRFVSDNTVEVNILQKSNHKRMLDDVIIQEGDFTPEKFETLREDGVDEELKDRNTGANAVIAKFFDSGIGRMLEHVEDNEDIQAAANAQKENNTTDEFDFDDKVDPGNKAVPENVSETNLTSAATSRPVAVPISTTRMIASADEGSSVIKQDDEVWVSDKAIGEEPEHYQYAMLRFMQYELRDEVYVPDSVRARKKSKKGKDHGIRIRT